MTRVALCACLVPAHRRVCSTVFWTISCPSLERVDDQKQLEQLSSAADYAAALSFSPWPGLGLLLPALRSTFASPSLGRQMDVDACANTSANLLLLNSIVGHQWHHRGLCAGRRGPTRALPRELVDVTLKCPLRRVLLVLLLGTGLERGRPCFRQHDQHVVSHRFCGDLYSKVVPPTNAQGLDLVRSGAAYERDCGSRFVWPRRALERPTLRRNRESNCAPTTPRCGRFHRPDLLGLHVRLFFCILYIPASHSCSLPLFFPCYLQTLLRSSVHRATKHDVAAATLPKIYQKGRVTQCLIHNGLKRSGS